MSEKIAVIGLGYVGLPLALAFARKFSNTIGFDINERRISELASGHDRTGESSSDELAATNITFTFNPELLRDCTMFIVAVPTPIDEAKRPDLTPVRKASELVGRVIKPGAVVVYESTVYPGVTEDYCGPIISRISGLQQGIDFKLGYSPERINPGDREHSLSRIIKVVAGEDRETLARVSAAYGAIVDAGVHEASSIKVAEAAKVIENTQRDLNIALMNELAMIFDLMNISTKDVLQAAATKWNFLRFSPGLVGGHCIGVDPYYLTMRAEELGYHPEVILAGRRINDGMGKFIAEKLVKLLAQADNCSIRQARVGIIGLTFKENVPDMRNSRVPDIINELRDFGIEPLIHDPLVDVEEAFAEYQLKLVPWEHLNDLDALLIAVPHQQFVEMELEQLLACCKKPAVIIDVKGICDRSKLAPETFYYCL